MLCLVNSLFQVKYVAGTRGNLKQGTQEKENTTLCGLWINLRFHGTVLK